MYKINNQLVDIDVEDHLNRPTRSGRGHRQKYTQILYNTRRYGDTFFPATLPDWNNLPETIINASSIASFKRGIQNYFN
jgi:hypothetical protein